MRMLALLAAWAVVGMMIPYNVLAAEPSIAPAAVVLGDHNFTVTVRTNGSELRREFGLRFDETAWVTQVVSGGQTFLHDGYGLMDEFGITGVGVLGYDQAPVGGKFLKIGVGWLIRGDNQPYQFWVRKELDAAAPSLSELKDGVLRVSQTMGKGGVYGYAYTKFYRVDSPTATLKIEYQLTNIGAQEFTFDQYNHDWFNFSRQAIDPRYQVSTQFPLDGATESDPWLKREGTQLRIAALVVKPASYKSSAQADARKNQFVVRGPAEQQVTVSGDFAVQRFLLYAQSDAICPEVFVQMNVTPGQTVSWTRTYRFATQGK